MKKASEIMPWKETNISIRPFNGFFSFNPSIHFDGNTWRCVMRNCDYHAKDGKYAVKNGRIITRNAMVIFDPKTWRAISLVEMRELDGLDRYPSSHYGYEDMRLFRVGGILLGIATTAQLRKESEQESVVCHFDDDYNINRVEVKRGPWSTIAQKNWTPFDGLSTPQYLYCLDRGLVFRSGDRWDASDPSYVRDIITPAEIVNAPVIHHPRGGVETRMLGRRSESPRGFDWTPKGVRGGTQLVRVDDMWLSMGHEMKLMGGLKNYWHCFYLVDIAGRLVAKSDDFKITNLGIEFAAGIGIDGDRVVVSYGTEDRDSWIGETKLSAVMETLKPCQ